MTTYKKLEMALEEHNNFLESIKDKYRYVLKRKVFDKPRPELKFFLLDECDGEIDAIQKYMQLVSAICYLQQMKVSDLKFEKRDSLIKSSINKALTTAWFDRNSDFEYEATIYDLITIRVEKVLNIGEITYKIIKKCLNDIGLDLNMSPVQIFKSRFFVENSHRFKKGFELNSWRNL